MGFIIFFAVIATLFAAWRVWRRLRYFLHIFQLEGYKPNEYRHWLKARFGDAVLRLSHKVALVVLAVATIGFFWVSPFWTAFLVLPAWAVTFASSRRYRSEQQKKPLSYSARLKRLMATAVAVTLVPFAAGLLLGLGQEGLAGYWAYLAGFLVADFGVPYWVLAAAALMKPVETSIQNGFKKQARRTLDARRELTVIGITGSYGKTSVKFIIAEILRQRYNVLETPGS
jgi:UDP-N-acetylmuramoyl-tripeptide--D-alanyl-D-alanine ligase